MLANYVQGWAATAWLPMRGFAPAPQCKGRNPLTNPSGPRSSWFLVYQNQLSIRGQGASMPLPARLESSKRCYWLWQTSGWNEWADKTVAAMPACFFGGALRAQNQKTKKQKNKKTKKRKFRAAGRQKRFRLLRFFPAHAGQRAGEKSR